MNIKAKTYQNAQQRAHARIGRLRAKNLQKALTHQQGRAAQDAKKPRKRLHERTLLIGVVAGVMADRLIVFSDYCKQIIFNTDLTQLTCIWNTCMALVGF